MLSVIAAVGVIQTHPQVWVHVNIVLCREEQVFVLDGAARMTIRMTISFQTPGAYLIRMVHPRLC